MPTWLDAYVNQYQLRAQSLLINLPYSKYFHPCLMPDLWAAARDPVGAIRYMAEWDLTVATHVLSGQVRFAPGLRSQVKWQVLVARFILPERYEPTVALLDSALVDRLAAAPISDEIRARGRTEARRRNFICLDIPRGALMIEKGVHLRALFMLAGLTEDDETLYTAIVTLPGQRHWRKIQWYEGDAVTLPDDFTDLTDEDKAYMKAFCMPGENKPGVQLVDVLDRVGLVLPEVLASIEAFGHHSLAYMGSHEREGVVPWSAVPYASLEDQRRHGKKARQVAKEFSLFKAQRVSIIPERPEVVRREPCGA